MSFFSEAQVRTLWALFRCGRWMRSGTYRARTNSLDSLVDAGLAERRRLYPALDYEYRLTAEGLAYLRELEPDGA